MKVSSLLVTLLGLCLSCKTLAAEPLTGNDILKKFDTAMTAAKDQVFQFEAVTVEPGKANKSLVFEVALKGTKSRRVRFLAPGDVKDTRVLVSDVDQMYVYLPAFQRVRRIASHVRNQGFMGTAMSYDDMAVATYSDMMDATLVAETPELWKIVAVKKPGKSFPFDKLEMDIRRDNHQSDEIRYFNDKGVKLKTDKRTDYVCEQGFCNPVTMKFTDHTRGDISTQLNRKKWKTNVGIKDSFFTVSELQRGNWIAGF